MADLGSGTGILSIVTAVNGSFTGSVYSFDKEAACIESTKLNAQLFGLTVKPIEIDLCEFYMPRGTNKCTPNQLEFYKSITSELGLPMQFDLITCNPPWIPAEYIAESSPLDNGVYDPKETFLKSALNFARLHLSPRGEMLLIYSDLALLLGL
jgi:methylase of polypeptide subunit release factors